MRRSGDAGNFSPPAAYHALSPACGCLLHPQLGEILPLADSQQVVWEVHQELSGGEGGSSLYEGYCDQPVMGNHRLFSLFCGRYPGGADIADPDCRRRDCPPGFVEDLPAGEIIQWPGFNQDWDKDKGTAFTSYFISRIRTSIPSSPFNSSTILAVSVLP
ncbi:hypothetical protein ES703_15354 [subsurface metagenome]